MLLCLRVDFYPFHNNLFIVGNVVLKTKHIHLEGM